MMNSKMNNVEECVREITNRITDLEGRYEEVPTDVDNLETQLDKMRQNVFTDIKEQNQRLIRKCNLIIMGIAENTEGKDLLNSLLEIILPPGVNPLVTERVGVLKEGKPAIRPLRIVLPTTQHCRITLKNCGLLKNKQEFKKISIQKDLTKVQQDERSPVFTRSSAGKRKQDHDEKQPLKQSCTEDQQESHMDM